MITNEMMRIVSLSDICNYVNSKIPVEQVQLANYVSTENLLQNKGGLSVANKLPSGKVTAFQVGDVLVSNIRPYFKKIWLADRSGGASNDVLVFRKLNDNVCEKYLYYILADDRFFAFSTASASGSKMPRGDKAQIMNYPINLPPLDQQKKIANILSSLDEKIELNRRMNETLEQLGQALFRHYFVDNPEAKNWDEGTLGDIMNITMGQSPPGKSYNNNGDGVVFYQGRADFGLRYPNMRLFTTDPKRFAKVGDVLLTVRAPVGDVNQASERCCIGRGLAAISSRTGAVSFCYYYCHQLKADFLEYNSEGTVFGSINSKQLKALKLKIPPIGLVEKFENEVAVIDKTIMLNSYQVKTLVVLRDSLLPKLISGGIEV